MRSAENQETLDQEDPKECRVFVEMLENQDHQGHLETMENEENQEEMEHRVRWDHGPSQVILV